MREALDKVCDSIPSRFSAQCRSYVRQYGDMIVDMMSQELTPENVRDITYEIFSCFP